MRERGLIMKVYVFCDKNGHVTDYDDLSAQIGFHKMGFEIVHFNDISELSKTHHAQDVIVSGIGHVKQRLTELGLEMPDIDYPLELEKYLGRKIWRSTINTVNSSPESWPVFVKPISNKRFIGRTITSTKDLIGCGNSYEDIDIYCSEPVRFLSEYRCFVRYCKILDVRLYKGDWRISFDTGTIENGYYISCGDFFEEEDIPAEQMTIWRGYTEGKDTVVKFRPARHDRSKTAWQEFGSIAVFPQISKNEDASKGVCTPGVINWGNKLKKERIIKLSKINIMTAAVVYDLTQATSLPVIDAIGDSLSFHCDLLTELGSAWRSHINGEIDKCERTANAIKYLSIDLQKASGASGDKISGDETKMQFYDRIDKSFRLWLESIKPSSRAHNDKNKELDDAIYLIARKFGEKLASQTGANSIFGRYSKSEKLSSAQALNKFIGIIKKILGQGGDRNG